MMIIMKRAQTLMPIHVHSEPLRDPLYREIAKLLKFKLIHNYALCIMNYAFFKYSSVLLYSPV